jgi:hypothetical protein
LPSSVAKEAAKDLQCAPLKTKGFHFAGNECRLQQHSADKKIIKIPTHGVYLNNSQI